MGITTLAAKRILVSLAWPLLLCAIASAEEQKQVGFLRVPDRGIQPQVVADGKGVVHLIYFRGEPSHGDLFYVRSEDAGATFSRPLQINSQQGSAIATGSIRGAHLAVGKGGRVHVAWNGSGNKGHANDGMFYTRLNDNRMAFEPQRNLIQAAAGLDGGGSVAADESGNVYVAWHAPEPGKKGEDNRRVWVARSTDEGRTFAREQPAYDPATGACGCCGLRVFADRKGNVYVLYRSATQSVNRDSYLLTSRNQGMTFEGEKVHAWKIGTCPMSSFGFGESAAGVLASWETDGQVYYTRIDPASGKKSEPAAAPGEGNARKHPVMAGNDKGETILAWTEGTGWNRGGSVAWQVFDQEGKPTSVKGRKDGVPTWSLVAVFARSDGTFTVIY